MNAATKQQMFKSPSGWHKAATEARDTEAMFRELVKNNNRRAAQDCESYDRAIDFERFGGQIIEMPANSFN